MAIRRLLAGSVWVLGPKQLKGPPRGAIGGCFFGKVRYGKVRYGSGILSPFYGISRRLTSFFVVQSIVHDSACIVMPVMYTEIIEPSRKLQCFDDFFSITMPSKCSRDGLNGILLEVAGAP